MSVALGANVLGGDIQAYDSKANGLTRLLGAIHRLWLSRFTDSGAHCKEGRPAGSRLLRKSVCSLASHKYRNLEGSQYLITGYLYGFRARIRS